MAAAAPGIARTTPTRSRSARARGTVAERTNAVEVTKTETGADSDPSGKAAEPYVSAMRLRAYPGRGQAARLGAWLWVRHDFRNAAAVWLETRRDARWTWVKNRGTLPGTPWRDLPWPKHLAGSDIKALSSWLTAQLAAARAFAVREWGLPESKQSFGLAVAEHWATLSPAARDAVRKRAVTAGLHVDWLRVLRTILNQTVRDLEKTYAKAFSDRSKDSGPRTRRAGFPTPHKYSFAASVRLQVEATKNAAFREGWACGKLVIPGLGRLPIREGGRNRPAKKPPKKPEQNRGYVWPATPPKLVTVARDAAGRWYVSFVCAAGQGAGARRRRLIRNKTDWQPLPRTADDGLAVEGLDMSLPHLAVSDTHDELGRQRYRKRYAAKEQRLQRKLARQQRGSHHWRDTARKLGRLHARAADQRSADLRRVAQRVADRSAIVAVEDLNLAFLTRNRHLAGSAYDLAWGRFLGFLEQAMAARGHLLVRAGRFTPTTQTCSTPGCTYRNRDLKGLDGLAIRAWTCPACGADHERDVNAARNILADGLRRFQASLETNDPLDPTPPDSSGSAEADPLSCPGTSVPGAGGIHAVPSSTAAGVAADSSGVVRRRLRAERAQDLAHLHPELRAICARGGLQDVLQDTEARTQAAVRGPPALQNTGACVGASVMDACLAGPKRRGPVPQTVRAGRTGAGGMRARL